MHTPKSQQQPPPQTQTQPEDPGAAATAPSDAVDSEARIAEEIARMVWGFVNAAGGLVEELDTEVSAAEHLPLSSLLPRRGLGHDRSCLSICNMMLTMYRLLLQDELKLLRVRTKKQELVIVPDPRYLLIVIHETPAA